MSRFSNPISSRLNSPRWWAAGPARCTTFVPRSRRPWTSIGNLPYYITSDIVLRILELHQNIERAVIMVQREVADRIAAEPGSRDYGLLSATAQLFARVDKLFTLPPGAFSPPPQVHSSVLRLTMAPRLQELQVEEEPFIAFPEAGVRAEAQNAGRTTFAANMTRAAIRAALKSAGLRADVRAEAMSLEKTAAVFRAFASRRKLLARGADAHGNRNPSASRCRTLLSGQCAAPARRDGDATPRARRRLADRGKIRALGCVVPHAGYMYSGHVAGAVYRRLDLPRRLVILCPNHTGMGEPLAIMSEGAWHTPLGDVPIDEELAAELKSAHAACSPKTRRRTASSMRWKCSFPFCRCWRQDFKFVPIAVGTSNFEALSALGVVDRQCVAPKQGERGPGHCFQRHEPLRERQRYPGERPQSHRSVSGARSPRTVRRRARGRYQHVRIRSGGGDADRGPEAGRDAG